jgi:hypothetical protein
VQAWDKLDAGQVQSLIDLRDALSDMNDEQLDAFLDLLRKLSDELANITAPNIEWLQQIVKISDFLKGLDGSSERRAREFGRVIRVLAEEAGKVTQPPNIEWLAGLVKVGDLLRGIDDSAERRAANYGKALVAIANAMNSVDAPDISWLESVAKFALPDVDASRADAFVAAVRSIGRSLRGFEGLDLSAITELVNAMAGLDGPGEYKITVDLPEEGLVLQMPDGFESTLQDIEGHLKVLASLRGVIWA